MLSRTLPRSLKASNTLLQSNKSVAVILSGCGVYDGTEITEAVSTLIHLSSANAKIQCYAPDVKQMHVVNHIDGSEINQERNVLIESARISRGKISDLKDLKVSKYEALIIPGGFGAAKNLSNFATEGQNMELNPTVSSAILKFHTNSKPIGLCCIAPVLAARCIPGVKVTVGSSTASDSWPHAGAAGAIEGMGGAHEETDEKGVSVDLQNKVVTSSAFMHEGSFASVHESVGLMVKEVLKLA